MILTGRNAGKLSNVRMLCSIAIDSTYKNSNGTFFKYDGKMIRSNSYSYDKDLQEKLRALTKKVAK